MQKVWTMSLENRFNKQYLMPPVEDFQAPYRFLHPHEEPETDDEVWNFHFQAWMPWREWVDGLTRESYKVKNPVKASPRLNIMRTKRLLSKYESTHPLFED